MRFPRELQGIVRSAALMFLAAAALPGAAAAQDDTADGGIAWEEGPGTGDLGGEAEIAYPESCVFAGAEGAQRFLELTENPTDGSERGVLICQTAGGAPDTTAGEWWVIFSFDPSGYVSDDEKDELDADAILASIKEGSEAANEEREKRGWGRFDIVGWVEKPYYDAATNNLTWSIDGKDPAEQHTVNHSVRLLGRGGVMHVDLVADPALMAAAVPAFNSTLAGFRFKPGHTYAEWREGDKVAAYGLTALVAGGAGAAAMKSGLIGKLWKVIVGALVAVGAGIKRLFGRKGEQTA